MNMEYVLGQLTNLLAIDSPSGYTKDVTDYLLKEFETLGFPAHRTVKGGRDRRPWRRGCRQCYFCRVPC